MVGSKHTCILHAGMAKTGTTAIQQFLSDNADNNNQYVYCHYDGIDSAFELVHLFHPDPITYREYDTGRLSEKQVNENREKAAIYVEEMLNKALSEDKILIFSWEGCWAFFSKESRDCFRNFMESRGFSVKLVIYVRPWKEIFESRFQQRIKGLGIGKFEPVPPDLSRGIMPEILIFDSIFGADNVKVLKYDLNLFENRDVVQHFCRETGIVHNGSPAIYSNNSLSVDAIKLLYAYNYYGPSMALRPIVRNTYPLVVALAGLKGKPVRLHSSLFYSLSEVIDKERPLLEHRLGGISMGEDIFRYDMEESTIKSESDMFNFSHDSLVWLAKQINDRPVSRASGEEASRMVVRQLHTLLLKLGKRESTSHRLIRKIRALFHYCKGRGKI